MCVVKIYYLFPRLALTIIYDHHFLELLIDGSLVKLEV